MGIARGFKDRINTGKPINSKKLISVIKNYDVISFDIFDTLLKRNVRRPSDVFVYVERKFVIPGFAKKRIEAEKKARERSNNAEIILQDIYREYGKDYTEYELRAESELLSVNDDMLPVYKYCVENKKVAYPFEWRCAAA